MEKMSYARTGEGSLVKVETEPRWRIIIAQKVAPHKW